MKTPIPYLYRVTRRRKAGRTRWHLAMVPPHGSPTDLCRYRSLQRAISAAHLLAMGVGTVEVRG